VATTDTNCTVTTCSFHHPDNKCAAGQIMVNKNKQEAICDTFVARDSDTKPVGRTSQEAAIEIRSARMADDARSVNLGNVGHLYEGDAVDLQPLVACNAAECRYNEHGVCFADSMTIDGSDAAMSRDTRCSTYQPA
jgi:hypothetical protein